LTNSSRGLIYLLLVVVVDAVEWRYTSVWD
jgi:hypothetical protein